LDALSATNLSAGTVPDARFPSTLPATSGANLTALPAANLTGTVADARMPNLTGAITTVEGAVATSITADAVGTDELANDVVINTSGAITTTGAFTSIGIDDNASGAVAITIDSSENVGIGETAPEALLELKSATPKIIIQGTASSTDGWVTAAITSAAHASAYTTGSIEFKSRSTSYVPITDIVFKNMKVNDSTAGEVVKMGHNGDVTISTGDLIFGTAGKGINLGVTANTDANTLDDYEEGSWSPTIARSGGGLTLASYQDQVGRYTKVGNMVYIWGNIRMDGIRDGSGTWQITNLPFTAELISVLYVSLFPGYNYLNGTETITQNGAAMRWQLNAVDTFSEYSSTGGTAHTTSVFMKSLNGAYRVP
jgi:hypothetical protein